ncbi:MAG: rhodanese-like domain-containing protein [Verrucomicrobia bacterium]|nr:rhodanese-like domain-containing protein [Verrucomicrobiota bacterium]
MGACAADAIKSYPLDKCFLSEHSLDDKAVTFIHQGQQLKVCCADCKAEFDKNPTAALAKLAAATKPFRNVKAAEFEKLRADSKNLVLDVRTKKEFDAGHVPGAIHIDVNGPDFMEKLGKLDKSRTYLVHCAAGGRSVTACNKLAPAGFKSLINLEGGYRGWEKAGYKGEADSGSK